MVSTIVSAIVSSTESLEVSSWFQGNSFSSKTGSSTISVISDSAILDEIFSFSALISSSVGAISFATTGASTSKTDSFVFAPTLLINNAAIRFFISSIFVFGITICTPLPSSKRLIVCIFILYMLLSFFITK